MKKTSIGLGILGMLIVITTALVEATQDTVQKTINVALNVPSIIISSLEIEEILISIIWECNCSQCNTPPSKIIKKAYPQKIHKLIENVHAIKMNIFTNINVRIYGHGPTNPKEEIYVLIIKDAKITTQTKLDCKERNWIQLYNEPQELFVKKEANKTELYVLVLKAKIDNPQHNTENPKDDEADITLTLIPIMM